jgi:hypothetical protein
MARTFQSIVNDNVIMGIAEAALPPIDVIRLQVFVVKALANVK